MGSDSQHVLMLPFMARGHLIPFLELAKQIRRRTGFIITILNTAANIQFLRSQLLGSGVDEAAGGIRLVELPFCASDHGLPPNVESTRGLSLPQMIDLFYASTGLEAPLRRFILEEIIAKEGRPPLCIIADLFFGWAFDLAKNLRSVGVTFCTGGAYGTAAYVSLWKDIPQRHSNDGEFTLPGFPKSHRFHVSQLHKFLRAADGTDSWSRYFQPQLSKTVNSSGWLLNTVEEIEPLGMSIIRNYVKLPVWPVGPLLPPFMLSPPPASDPHDRKDRCVSWLDSQPHDSVLYISFGSQNTITLTQMMELAIGLEESGKPFIWVIRPPFGFDLEGEFREEWLPIGFESRLSETEKGMVVKKWAPQMEILSHRSTGAFLSHCGWNSVLESLSQGVPIVGWPLASEQAYNSKMLAEEMGVSVELTRGLEGNVTKENVKKIVELVLNREGKGGDMKKKAVEVGKHLRAAMKEDEFEKGSSLRAMDDFVDTILSSVSHQPV
ncbi:hypothetical protein Nepgr_013933 [Nepenthes gracilis]|uniref:Glycosyltransferase n=1 Tax=Nepenthes gracilis TaxID=150966 RepID=A0AAD3SK50_NEPGR|nr:hypothetical protein Nepgr_013933 [Nepenthes gracilis]